MRILQAESAPERLAIHRPGSSAPLLVQHTPAHRRPFIHPLAAPDGQGELTEDMPAHHPWQRGLYVGLNDLDGVGFWKEGTSAAGGAMAPFTRCRCGLWCWRADKFPGKYTPSGRLLAEPRC